MFINYHKRWWNAWLKYLSFLIKSKTKTMVNDVQIYKYFWKRVVQINKNVRILHFLQNHPCMLIVIFDLNSFSSRAYRYLLPHIIFILRMSITDNLVKKSETLVDRWSRPCFNLNPMQLSFGKLVAYFCKLSVAYFVLDW